MLVDEGVLGGCGKKILLFVLVIGRLVGGDVGENVKTKFRGGGDGGTSDDVCGAVGDVEERVVLWVVKDRPGEFGSWGTWNDRLEDAGGDVERAWVVPSVVRALEDFKDGCGGVCNVLLVDVIKGGPGGNGDVGEGGGDDDGGLRSEQHSILN